MRHFLNELCRVGHLSLVCMIATVIIELGMPAKARADQISTSLDYGELRQVEGDADFALLDGSVTLSKPHGGFQLKAAAEVPLDGGSVGLEGQLRYFRNVRPAITLVAGSRIDFAPEDNIAMLMIGVGLELPLGFTGEGLLFLDENGHLLARTELASTISITPRLLLQSKVEANWSRDGARFGIGGGPEAIEAALRLGYLLDDEITVYAGVIEGRTLGSAARQLRTEGQKSHSTSLVIGISSGF